MAASGRMSTGAAMVTGFEVLGLMHHSLARARLPAAADTVAYANHVRAEDALVLATAGAERVRGWGDLQLLRYAGEVVDHLAEVSAGEGPLLGGQRRQLVHGDFWDNNVLFSGGAVVAVLDFGFMAERTRIDDLALPISFWLLGTEEPPPGSSDLDLVTALLAAYDRHTDPLTEEERLALPLAVARQPAVVDRSLGPRAPRAGGRGARPGRRAGAVDRTGGAARPRPVAVGAGGLNRHSWPRQ